jgi:hypothetical protein
VVAGVALVFVVEDAVVVVVVEAIVEVVVVEGEVVVDVDVDVVSKTEVDVAAEVGEVDVVPAALAQAETMRAIARRRLRRSNDPRRSPGSARPRRPR